MIKNYCQNRIFYAILARLGSVGCGTISLKVINHIVMMHFWSVCLLLVVVIVLPTAHSQYIVDDSKLGPVFDGIGGLSGGGVSEMVKC